MNLYLVQHGQAETKDIDPARPLSEGGKKKLLKVAEIVGKNYSVSGIKQIFHSSKLRARQTAENLAQALNLTTPSETDHLSPLDDPCIWANRLKEESDDLMLVGHLPHLARLTGLLLCGNKEKEVVRFQMGGIAALSKEKDSWTLSWMVVPAMDI